jgi:hypothetical protein
MIERLPRVRDPVDVGLGGEMHALSCRVQNRCKLDRPIQRLACNFNENRAQARDSVGSTVGRIYRPRCKQRGAAGAAL